jgi:hypothetical protein
VTRFAVRLATASGVVDVVVLATHEGDAWRAWGALDAREKNRPLTCIERAQAEAAVTALVSQQADLFAKGA